MGQERTSKVKEPAIWPARVDVKAVTKKAGTSLASLFEFHVFLTATDCNGEIRIMKPIIEFIQTLGIAEIVIGIALIAVCVYGYFDCKSIDKNYDADNERFEKRRKK